MDLRDASHEEAVEAIRKAGNPVSFLVQSIIHRPRVSQQRWPPPVHPVHPSEPGTSCAIAPDSPRINCTFGADVPRGRGLFPAALLQ